MNREAATDEHDLPGRAEDARLGDAVPHNPRNAPGAVADREPEILSAVAAGADFHLAHEQRLLHLASICELADLHGDAKIE
jgi:hypothetical protein